MPVLCPRDWVQRITTTEKSFPKQLSLHTFQHTAPNMKLHLPKRLFTALLTAITLAAAPAALTLGSAAWGEESGEVIEDETSSAIEEVTYRGTVYTWNNSTTQSYHTGPWISGNASSTTDWGNVSKNGHTIRFTDAATFNGITSTGFQFDGLKVGGFIVEESASIECLYAANGSNVSTTAARALQIGVVNENSGSTIKDDFEVKSNNGSITLAGKQIWEVADGKTYTINSGTGTISLGENQSITIRKYGEGEGVGTAALTGSFTNGGSVIVGSGASLNLSGGYTQAAGASLTVNGSLTLGGSVVLYDAITANGEVTLGSGVVFDLAHLTAGEDNCYTLFTGAESVTFSDVSFTNGRGGWSYTMQSNGTALATLNANTVIWKGDNDANTTFEWGTSTEFTEGGTFSANDDVYITGSDAIKLTGDVTANTVTIGAYDGSDITVSFTDGSNILKVTEGLIIQDGATVEINKQTDSVGFIQGEVTIENGGVLKFNKKDVTGYNGGATSMHTINVLAGGELQMKLSGENNNETFTGTLNLDGTLKGLVSGTASTWDLFSSNNSKGTIVVGSGASAEMDNINIRLRQDNSVITVGENATLNLSGTITKWTEGNGVLYKEGAGAMTVGGAVTLPSIYLKAGSLTFNDTVSLSGGMNIGDSDNSHPTTQLVFAGSGKEHKINGTLKVDGKNTSISIAEGSSLTVGTLNLSWMMSGLTVNGILEATTQMIIGSGYNSGNAWNDKFTGAGQVVTKKLITNNGATTSIGVNSLTIGDGGLSMSASSTLTLKSLTTTIAGETNVTAGTHLKLASGTVTMNGNLSSTGTLTIDSGAKLELNGASNTVSGTFTVNNGAAITLGTGAVLDLTGMNVRPIFESVIKATSGSGLVKFQGIDAFPGADENENTWRVSLGNSVTLNTDVSIEKCVTFNMGGITNGGEFNVNGKNLTVGGDLRFENKATLKVGSGSVAVAGSILLGHQDTGHPGHIVLSGGKITAGTIRETNTNDSNASLTVSGGELKLTQNGATITGIHTHISGGKLIADSASWGIEGTADSTLGNVSFDIAAGQSITLSGAMSLTGTLTHSGAGELVFNSSLSMSQEALNSLRITTTEVAADENGLSYLQYHLVNATAGGTMSGTANAVVVGDDSLSFDASTGIISSNDKAYVINGVYSTTDVDAATTLAAATLGVMVGEKGQFTIAGNVSDDLTVNTILSSTAGTGTLVLTASGVVLNKENGLSNFHGKLQVGEGKSLEINDQNNFLNLTNLQEIELLAGAVMDVRYGTGIKANTIKMNGGSRLQLHNGGGNYNTLEANLLIAGNATLDTSTYGDKTQVLGTISGNGTLSIEKESNNTWVLASTITDGTGAGDALALHFTDAPSGASFVHITGDNSYSRGTTIDVGNIKIGHVNALGTGNVTLKESAALILESDLSIQGTLNSAGAITMGANTTLTLGGGTAEAQKQHSISTLTGGAGSTLDLAQHSVLNKVNTINGTVFLTGSGKYDLGALATQWATGNAADILGVTLADDWTGVVKVSGNTSSSDNDVNGAKLNDLAKANSWVELDGVEGWLFNVDGTGSSYDHAANLILSGAGLTINASSQRTYIFSKSIKGTGDFTLATSSGDPLSYNFTGNISEWAGAFVVDANGSATPTTTLNLTGGGNLFSGEKVSGEKVIGVVMNRGGELNVNIGKDDADTTMRGSIGFGEDVKTGTLNLNVQGNTEFQKKVEASQITVNSGKTATFNNTATAGAVNNSGQIKLGKIVTNGEEKEMQVVATVAGGTMSKVQMSSTSITGSPQDGSSSMSNADIEVLAQDATFTIADMTLTNTSINAASVNTQVNLTNVSASATQLSGGKFVVTNQATMNTAQVATGGSEGRITFSASTTLLSGITLDSGSITVDLGDLSSYAAMGPGKYDLSITLSGFRMSEYDGDYANSALQFAAGSWLSELLAQDNNANVQISITQATEGAAAAAAGVSGGSTGVSYSTGNVGMVITITGLNVPEPTTSTLSLLALAALAGRRRRK